MTNPVLDDITRLEHRVAELTDRNEIADLVYRLIRGSSSRCVQDHTSRQAHA
jgi:hypothetical protein